MSEKFKEMKESLDMLVSDLRRMMKAEVGIGLVCIIHTICSFVERHIGIGFEGEGFIGTYMSYMNPMYYFVSEGLSNSMSHIKSNFSNPYYGYSNNAVSSDKIAKIMKYVYCEDKKKHLTTKIVEDGTFIMYIDVRTLTEDVIAAIDLFYKDCENREISYREKYVLDRDI